MDAVSAWRAWVAEARNSPMRDTGMGETACALCGNTEYEEHDPACPYRLMREEIARAAVE